MQNITPFAAMFERRTVGVFRLE